MKRIGKFALAAALVTGLGVQAYAVSSGSSSINLLDAAPVAGDETTDEATQLIFSLDEVEPAAELEPAPSNVLEVGTIAENAEATDEELVQCDTCGGGSIVSDTVVSEAYYPATTSGYAPATYSSSGGFLSGGGGGFGGGGAGGGLAGGSSALRLGLIGAAVGIPLAVSSDDDDNVVYPAN